MKTTICAMMGSVTLLLSVAMAAQAADGVFAAVGLSKNADALLAAEQASRQMMDQFTAAGRKPAAVLFLERVAKSGNKKGQQIGDTVKKLAGGAPTFGHGGCDVYGLTWGADVKHQESTFMVLGLDAPNLVARGSAVGGRINYSYPKKDKPKEAEKVAKWESDWANEREYRQLARQQGAALGAKVSKLSKPGFVLVLGALHNNWHMTFMEGLRSAAGDDVPVIGGVGSWDDFVYCDGESLVDRNGNATVVGQIAVAIEADWKVVLAGEVCQDTHKRAVAEATIDSVLAKVADQFKEKKPAALLAFSCVTLLRDNKTMDPSAYYPKLQAVAGDTIFGCFCGGELGITNDGSFTVGGNRFVVAAVGE